MVNSAASSWRSRSASHGAIGDVKGVATVKFDQRDVVRHHLVTKIVQAYDEKDALRDRLKKGYRGNKDGADGNAEAETDNDGTA